MKITLRKIKKACFDDLRKVIVKNFEATGSLNFPEELIESNSETIIIDGNCIEIDIDIDKYKRIITENTYDYTKFAKIGMALHKDLKSDTVNIPRNIFYEKELWAYLAMTVFCDVVWALKLEGKGTVTGDKISKIYFSMGEMTRTSLYFWWVMVDRLSSEDDYDITHTAFEFVDPVKAMIERSSMSKNSNIPRAFVQGIINNGKDSRFKSDRFRSKVPSHIKCYASVSILDALEYSELVEVIAEQQKAIISEK